MEPHTNYNDDEFIKRLEDCTMLPEEFSHEAHLRLAWIQIHRFGLVEAEQNVIRLIKNYVGHLGVSDKFNLTLTIAAVKAVAHFMERSPSTNFEGLLAEFPRLKSSFKELMARHYSFDIYNSELAKTSYLEPDLLSFEM